MSRIVLLLLSLLLIPALEAQDFDYRDELRFVEGLRSRGDNDLALEYLRRLEKNAPPELLKELPLELAKTSLRVAGDEPETAKRLLIYAEARENFKKFIAENPGHPRLAEANFDIARVLDLQGKTELNQAMLADDRKTRRELAASAEARLKEAAIQLTEASKVFEAEKTKLADPETITEPRKKKEAQAAIQAAENQFAQVQLERALNLYSQGEVLVLLNRDEDASKVFVEARKVLEPIANGSPNSSLTWKARAWLGRLLYETESAERARAKFQEVLAGTGPAAAEGIRLARYFRARVIKEKPDEKEKPKLNATLLDIGTRWRQDYPRFLKTPEGCGMTFLLAEVLLSEANRPKQATLTASQYRDRAIALLRELESSENEFTERAKRLKLQAMYQQGVFKVPIAKLNTFEQCYVRAQYEAYEMSQDAEKLKGDAKAIEAKRTERINTILEVLKRGLSMKEVAKMKANLDLNNARAMLTYWAMTTGKLQEAIEAGETFARNDPRSSQAEMSAVYALQAYTQLLQKVDKVDENNEDRARMFSLASYMESRWPNTIGGDIARHTVGLQLLREENYPEAIKKLSLIGPSYNNYAQVCYQIADACLRAHRNGIEPINGDRPGDYRKRVLVSLQSIPESTLGVDPFLNAVYYQSQCMLGRELFSYKRFTQMNELASKLLSRIDQVTFNEDPEKNRQFRAQFAFELVDLRLYASYGLAAAAFDAGRYAEVLELTDPLVDAARKEDSQEIQNFRKNPQLGSALLLLALRSNIQLGRIDRTDQTLDLMDRLSDDPASAANATNTLKLIAFLIRGQVEELRKKGDQEALKKAVDGYTALLKKRVDKQKGEPTLEFTRVLASCYSSMGKHAEAADMLAKVTNAQGDEKTFRLIQLMRVAELRQSKTADNLKLARQLLSSYMTLPNGKPNWGAKDLLARKENAMLLEAEGKYREAFNSWSELTKLLSTRINQGPVVKDHFFDCYYHMVYSFLKQGLSEPNPTAQQEALRKAAQQILQLESSFEDFGGDTSKKRFEELLASEAGLRAQYEALKKAKK